MSKSQDYFAVLADDNNLYIFYVCPEECSDCNFPENCSSCKNDFILKGTTCVPKPTHCVNNVEIDGICEEYCNK